MEIKCENIRSVEAGFKWVFERWVFSNPQLKSHFYSLKIRSGFLKVGFVEKYGLKQSSNHIGKNVKMKNAAKI